jgi:Na+-driven multidrug efflux pump
VGRFHDRREGDQVTDGAGARGAGGRSSRAAILDGPIPATLVRMAWPIGASALLGEAQGVISTFWIGRLIGVAGLATLAVVGPVLVALALVGGAVPLGVQVLTARSAGSQDGRALPIIVNGAYLAIAWGVAVMAIGLALLHPINHALAGDLAIAGSLERYLFPFLLFYPVPMISGVVTFAVGATGWTRFGLIYNVVSIGLMVALMPVFAGVLDLGLAGVALSDGCSDMLLLLLSCYVIHKLRNDLGLGVWQRMHRRLDLASWRRILVAGVPYQLARGMDFVTQVALVRVMMASGDNATVAGYGVAMVVITLAVSVVGSLGVAAGIMVGQNAGAKQWARAQAIVRFTLTWLAILGVALAILAAFAEPVFRLFSDDARVVSEAAAIAGALRWSIPANMLGSLMLRAYTAIAPNKLANALSILCGAITIVLAHVWPGAALERLTVAVLAGSYLRLIVLSSVYPRYFPRYFRATSAR